MLSSGVGSAGEASRKLYKYHKVSLERIRDKSHSQRASGEREVQKGTTAKEQVVNIRHRTTANEPVARRTK